MELWFSCKYWNCYFFVFSKHNFFVSVKEIHNLWSLMNNNKCTNEITVTKTKRPLKYRALSGISWSWWGRYWLRHKLPGFRWSSAIHYYTQSVWAIALDLNMVYSVFLSLISFLEAPWYGLVCYVQSIITKTRGILKLSS